jgi:hypothetical protein
MPLPRNIVDAIIANLHNGRYVDTTGSPKWGAHWETPTNQTDWEYCDDTRLFPSHNVNDVNSLHRLTLSSHRGETLPILVAKIYKERGLFGPGCGVCSVVYDKGITLDPLTVSRDPRSIQGLFLETASDSPRFLIGQDRVANAGHNFERIGWWDLSGAIDEPFRNVWLPRIAECVQNNDRPCLVTLKHVLYHELGRPWPWAPWIRVPYSWTQRGQWLLIYLALCRAVKMTRA